VLGCSERPRSGRGVDRLGVSTLSVHRPCFLEHALLAPVPSRTKLIASLIPLLYQQIFERVGLRKLKANGCLWFLLRRCGDNIFYNGAEVARGDNVPSGGNIFVLGGGPFVVSRLFFQGHGLLERLF